MTDALLSAFVREFPEASEIQDMFLKGCSRVTDAGVIALAETCKRLSMVDLQDCGEVTDKGIIALADNCKSLSDVKFRGR